MKIRLVCKSELAKIAKGSKNWTTTFTPGDVVKYTRLEFDEEKDYRFVVIEDNGDRVLIELLNSGLPIPPQEMVRPSDIERAQ